MPWKEWGFIKYVYPRNIQREGSKDTLETENVE